MKPASLHLAHTFGRRSGKRAAQVLHREIREQPVFSVKEVRFLSDIKRTVYGTRCHITGRFRHNPEHDGA